MRAYYFGNMYLSSIQQGIQAAHVTHELFTKYDGNPGSELNALHIWAAEHKTMILLNAGYGENIRSLVSRFDDPENPYPWADFHEAEESLDGAITCVGIVLPEKIYETAAYIRSVPFREKDKILAQVEDTGVIKLWDESGNVNEYELSKWEFNFIQELNNFRMAS